MSNKNQKHLLLLNEQNKIQSILFIGQNNSFNFDGFALELSLTEKSPTTYIHRKYGIFDIISD